MMMAPIGDDNHLVIALTGVYSAGLRLERYPSLFDIAESEHACLQSFGIYQ